MTRRQSDLLQGAGGFVLVILVLAWAMSSFPQLVNDNPDPEQAMSGPIEAR
jgi:hypothetical protein